MGGDSSVGDGKSVRKRLAASIRRVMSIGKRDGGASTSKETPVPEPIPVVTAVATATAPVTVAAPIGYVTVLDAR